MALGCALLGRARVNVAPLLAPERFPHPRQRFRRLRQHQRHGKPQHAIPEPDERAVPARVSRGAAGMVAAVDFQDDAHARRAKVSDSGRASEVHSAPGGFPSVSGCVTRPREYARRGVCAVVPGSYVRAGAWREACAQCRSPAAGGRWVLWWNGQRLLEARQLPLCSRA